MSQRLNLGPSQLVLAVGVAALALFIAYPVVFTIHSSLWSAQPGSPGHYTLGNYYEVFSARSTYTALLNTLFAAASSAVLAICVAVVLSIITVRTDTPLRGLLFYLPFFPLAFPVLIANQAWIYVFEQRAGLMNMAVGYLGLSTSTFNIYSWPGLIWASTMALTPVCYITISSGMRGMDPSLEEASRMSGSGVMRTLWSISLPLASPSILSAFLLAFTLSAGSFETPTMIGLPAKISVLMSGIYNNVNAIVPPDYAAASTESVIMLAMVLALVYAYNRSLRATRRYEVVSGRGYSGRVLALGSWRYVSLLVIVAYLVVAIALPLVTILLLSLVPIWIPGSLLARASLKNYEFLLSSGSGVFPALLNSMVSSVLAATSVSVLALLIVFASRRTKIPGRGILEGIGMFPIAMPALVISFGLLWAFLTIPTGIYGTLWVMVIALAISHLPQGIRSISGGVIQIQKELQEASRLSGASNATTLVRIFLPLLRSGLASTWLYVFITSFTALGSVLLLTSAHNQLFTTLLWTFWSSGNPGSANSFAAGSVLLCAILACMIALMLLLQRRLEIKG